MSGMIAYRDFEPIFPDPPHKSFSRDDLRGYFDAAVAFANEWIDRESIRVLNVETITHGGMPFWLGGKPLFARTFRVWYQIPHSSP